MPEKVFLSLILGLMAAGLFLRAAELDLTAYNIDEASLSIYSSQVANLRSFPLAGIRTSFGFHNPPLLIYLMAPFFRLSVDPRFAMLGLAMAGAAAVGLTGLTAQRLWGGWAGVAAAALLAFSPNAIEHSRRLWGHDTILFWSALCAYATVRGVQLERKRWMWIAVTCAAGAQACHLSGVFLWIFALGGTALLPRAKRIGILAFGLMVALAVYLPWLIYDATGSGNGGHFAELTSIAGMAVSGGSSARTRPSPAPAIITWLTLLTDGAHNDLFGPEYGEFLFHRDWFAIFFVAAQGLFTSLLLAGMASLIYVFRTQREHDKKGVRWARLLVAWAGAPAIVFTLLPVEAVPPYQLPALVPCVLAAAFFLSRCGGFLAGLRKKAEIHATDTPFTAVALVIVLLFAVAFGMTYTFRARRYLAAATPENQVSSLLRFKLDAILHIVGTAMNTPYAIMQDARGPNSGIDYWVLYLHYRVTGNSHVPTDRDTPNIFLILDNKTILRREAAAWLAGRPSVPFGTLSVLRLRGRDALEWRELVRKFPSRAAGDQPAPAPGEFAPEGT
ncbi:glycosyltransferase family 39 protein [Candidatus Poribacteria bacterium]|nr:glycosyltransferase family 39 protein [Candidatus Poribacteria bacterium]